MRLLLDTHAFIYLVRDPTALPDVARSAIEDPGNELLLSLASAWEIQIKVMLGKLTLGKPLHESIQTELTEEPSDCSRSHWSTSTLCLVCPLITAILSTAFSSPRRFTNA